MKKGLLLATVIFTTLALVTSVLGEQKEKRETRSFEKEMAQMNVETNTKETISSSKENDVSTEETTDESSTSSTKEKQINKAKYTIQDGDTISRILSVTKCSEKTLKKLNDWKEWPQLVAGKTIFVPKDKLDDLKKKIKQSKEASSVSATEEISTFIQENTQTTIQEVPSSTVQVPIQQPVQSMPQPVPQAPVVEAPVSETQVVTATPMQ